MFVGSKTSGGAVPPLADVVEAAFRFCLSFSSAPVPHSNLPPFALSSHRVRSRYLAVSTVF